MPPCTHTLLSGVSTPPCPALGPLHCGLDSFCPTVSSPWERSSPRSRQVCEGGSAGLPFNASESIQIQAVLQGLTFWSPLLLGTVTDKHSSEILESVLLCY